MIAVVQTVPLWVVGLAALLAFSVAFGIGARMALLEHRAEQHEDQVDVEQAVQLLGGPARGGCSDCGLEAAA